MAEHITALLVAETSSGKHKYWQGHAVERPDGTFTYSIFWQEGGKKSMSAETRIAGKVKRSDWEQAVAEIESQAQTKRNKGYRNTEGEDTHVRPPILPMLAQDYGKRAHDVVFPCFVQGKENGVRCLYGDHGFWTRNGKAFPEDVTAHLAFPRQPGLVYDGELVMPAPYTFQESLAHTKKYRPQTAHLLEYRLYDVYDPERPDWPYRERLAFLAESAAFFPETVFVVETSEASAHDDVGRIHQQFVDRGYEGIMLRNADAPYKPDHRSKDLQKVKAMKDAEFQIAAVEEGRGRMVGMPIFVCLNADGRFFRTGLKGPEAYRRELWQRRHELVGKPITVQYQALTDDGLPQFPVGLAIRDYDG